MWDEMPLVGRECPQEDYSSFLASRLNQNSPTTRLATLSCAGIPETTDVLHVGDDMASTWVHGVFVFTVLPKCLNGFPNIDDRNQEFVGAAINCMSFEQGMK